MLNIRIIHRQDHSAALKINCADQEVFKWCVAALKQSIPQSLRRFDFAMRYWIISEGASEQLANYLSRMQAVHCASVEQTAESDEERATRESNEQERHREPPHQETAQGGRGDRSGRRKGLHLARQMDMKSAYQVLYLMPGAPPEVIQSVYRVLAKMHHPDLGGSTAVMAEINDAYRYLMNALKDASAA